MVATTLSIPINARFEHAFSTEIMRNYDALLEDFEGRQSWKEMNERALWSELSLCILASRVPYEMARSAHSHLSGKGLMGSGQLLTPGCKARIAAELSKPICLPRKKDGILRRYRFPNSKASCLVEAAGFFYERTDEISPTLELFSDPFDARDYLADHVSGIGLKEASNFLRNIGFSDSLAIVDSHIVTFVREFGLMNTASSDGVDREFYLAVEEALLSISERNDLNLSILDIAIWHFMRGR